MIKIAFLGDISFNNDYNKIYEEGGNPFKGIENILASYDIVIGNLECISEGIEGENELRRPRLKTKIETLNFLKNLNISAVSLANNHVYDNLKNGFVKTTSFLKTNNIMYAGAGLSKNEAQKPLLIERDNKKLCFLSYIHEDTNPNLPENCPVHLNIYNKERIIEEIEYFKKMGYIVSLLLHWGGKFEGGRYPDRYQSLDAKEFITAGADLIIGHHSHTLQPYEIIYGKHVYYSLGNFCFSDVVFENKRKKILNSPRFTNSAIITLEIDKDYSYTITPIKNKNHYIIQKRKIALFLPLIRNYIFKVVRHFKIFWKLYALKHFKINPYLRMLYNVKEISYVKRLRKALSSKRKK